MKSSVSVIAILISSLIFSSCSKKEILNKYVNKESATVNGSAFTSTNTNADVNAISGAQQLTIDGTSATGERITIAINNFTGAAGSFTINGGSGTAIGAYSAGGSSDVIATSGTVTVISADNSSFTNGVVYSGTFDFTAPGYTVTAGSFSVFIHS